MDPLARKLHMAKDSRKTHRLLASGLLAAGLALGCLAAPAAATAAPKPKREPQHVSNLQLRESLNVLQATKKILQGADHDYGGHRVDAVKAIGAAEHQLRLALQSQHKRTKPSRTGVGGKQPEPQAISNLQLADSIRILSQTRTLLEKADRDYGGHRVAAVRDLGGAIHQLQAALKFERRTK
jgi:hypothetical protein